MNQKNIFSDLWLNGLELRKTNGNLLSHSLIVNNQYLFTFIILNIIYKHNVSTVMYAAKSVSDTGCLRIE